MVHFILFGKPLAQRRQSADSVRVGEMNKSEQRGQKKTGKIHFQTSTPDQNKNKVHQNRLARSRYNPILKRSSPIFPQTGIPFAEEGIRWN